MTYWVCEVMVGVLCPWEGDLEDGIITVPVR